MPTPKNPSEIQRLQEEGLDILNQLDRNAVRTSATNGADKGHKAAREALLVELRDIERTLEIEHTPYNSTDFFKRSRDALRNLRR